MSEKTRKLLNAVLVVVVVILLCLARAKEQQLRAWDMIGKYYIFEMDQYAAVSRLAVESNVRESVREILKTPNPYKEEVLKLGDRK